MKHLFSMLALLFIAASSFAQSTDLPTTLPIDLEGERNRIQADRTRMEAHYQLEDAQCYKKFAVTDCLRQVRVRRRAALDDLRRQEVVLNDAERKQKGFEEIERIQERSSAQRIAEDAARRLEAREAQKERQERANEKAGSSTNAKSGQTTGKGVPKTVELGRTADDIAKEQKQFNDKIRQAQEHRASREKSNNEKSGTPPKPLPESP